MLKKICLVCALGIMFAPTVASATYVKLNVPNDSAEARPYYNHTYVYYIYSSSNSVVCLPPKGNILQLGQYYEDEHGQYGPTRFFEDVSAFVGESNCISLVVSVGHPGLLNLLDTEAISGSYISNTPYLLSDEGLSVSFPESFHKIPTSF